MPFAFLQHPTTALNPTSESGATTPLNPTSDSGATTPLSISGTIRFDDIGMCEVEDMAEFIAATELVLAETACDNDSSQICTVRIVAGRWCGDFDFLIAQHVVTNPHNSSLWRAS